MIGCEAMWKAPWRVTNLGASPFEVEEMTSKVPVSPFVRQAGVTFHFSKTRGARTVDGVTMLYGGEQNPPQIHYDVGMVGWKLRLTALPGQHDRIDQWLTNFRYAFPAAIPVFDLDAKAWAPGAANLGPVFAVYYKSGQAQAGKDFTIYVGHRDLAVALAKKIEDGLRGSIQNPLQPGSAASRTDVPMTKAGLVSGRFGAYGVKWRSPTSSRIMAMANYGYQGFPGIEGVDVEFIGDDVAKPPGYARAFGQLATLFGPYFVGSAHPFQPRPPAGADATSLLGLRRR